MSAALSRWSVTALAIGLVALLSFGCVVAGGGYGDAGYGLGYYQPYGVPVGGWGADYHVAPYREGEHRRDEGGGRPAAHAYRPAPASRAMPSIPSHPRTGGGDRGGGHGGGDHGGGGERH